MTAPALLPYPDARKVEAEGVCDRCQQRRPLFLHEQAVTQYVEHDCPDCDGHDEEFTRQASLCPRCWSDTPTKVEQ